jgi:hypothetical protein
MPVIGFITAGSLAALRQQVAAFDDGVKDESFGPFLMELAHARESAKLLMDLISSAEARLAVALAVVEGDEDAGS